VECGGLPTAEAGLPPLYCDRVRRKPADEASHAHQTTGSKHALCRRARSPDESTGIRSHSRATPHDASRQSGVVEARGLIPANKSCRETPSFALSHPQHVVDLGRSAQPQRARCAARSRTLSSRTQPRLLRMAVRDLLFRFVAGPWVGTTANIPNLPHRCGGSARISCPERSRREPREKRCRETSSFALCHPQHVAEFASLPLSTLFRGSDLQVRQERPGLRPVPLRRFTRGMYSSFPRRSTAQSTGICLHVVSICELASNCVSAHQAEMRGAHSARARAAREGPPGPR